MSVKDVTARLESSRSPDPAPERPITDLWTAILRCVVALPVVLVPLVVSPAGHDVFRLPKELVFRATGILIIACAAAALATGYLRITRTAFRNRAVVLPLVILIWSGVSAVLSTNWAVSRVSWLWILYSSVFAVAAYWIARASTLRWINILFPAAVINTMILFAQRAGFNWLGSEDKLRASGSPVSMFQTALVGNPNDVGAYLLVPAIAAAAMSTVVPSRWLRRVYQLLTGLFALGIIMASSVGAILALVAGLLALTIVVGDRRLRIALGVAIVLTAAGALAHAPVRDQIHFAGRQVQEGGFHARTVNALMANRLIPAVAAVRMFRDHPITGVGVGAYAWNYFPYKIAVEQDHPSLRRSPGSFINFGEAHNDHLQILAVSGLPGYGLFVATLVLVAGRTLSRRAVASGGTDPRSHFARAFALPVVVTMVAASLTYFPLEVATTATTFIFAAASAVGIGEA